MVGGTRPRASPALDGAARIHDASGRVNKGKTRQKTRQKS